MANRVGQQVGQYRLLRLLGEGGFAEVYLGEHVHLGTLAAIKLLSAKLSAEEIERFRQEARTIARLRHPHIVRVLDFGVEGSVPYLVMDYAEGGTLRTLHPKGTQLSPEAIVPYVQQVASALQYAHDQKLIHRDVKPENMLLVESGEVLLSDFGIAIVSQSSRYQSTQDTAGTIAYMAPEQIQAHPRPASDQYSLGIVVYEWLTGDRPFHGGFSEIAIKHTIMPPPPLRERIPTVSPDVEQVVLTALAKDPKDRFGSMQAFARAFEQASLSDQHAHLAPTIIVKPPEPVVLASPLVTPSNTPSSPQLPPMQLARVSNEVGAILHIYRGHTGRVNTVAWAPDGERIASGSDDKTVQIWDAVTGEKISICTGHAKQVNAVAWSPDGSRVVSGSSDAKAQVWDPAAGNKIITYYHAGGVNTVKWSPNKQFIASAGESQEVQIWDSIQGFRVLSFRGRSHTVTDLSWSPNGVFLASAGNDSEIQIWNTSFGQKVLSYTNHSNWVNALCYSPDGTGLASASDDRSVQVTLLAPGRNLFSLQEPKSIFTLRGHSGKVFAVAWSPDGKYIVSGSLDGTVKIWDSTTGSNIYTYSGHSTKVGTVAWSPNGKMIASGSWDGAVHIWVAPSFM